MTSGAVLVQQLEEGDRCLEVTVSGGSVITKGDILKLVDPTTGEPSTASDTGVTFAGIAKSDKAVGSTEISRIAVWRNGVFDIAAADGETITAGDKVCISGANTVRRVDNSLISGGCVVGVALQDAVANEMVEVLVGA